jgi:hypothetical protein
MVVLRVHYRWVWTLVSVTRFLHGFEGDTSVSCGTARLAKQLADNFVGHSRYSHPPTQSHKFDNHASPGKRLAGARRSLDRKHRSLPGERFHKSLCGVRQLVILADQRPYVAPQH